MIQKEALNLAYKKESAESLLSNLKPKKDIPEKKKKSKKGGRPPVMDKNTLEKLKVCFSVGMTNEQACYFCGIHDSTLYKFQRNNEEFKKEKIYSKKILHFRVVLILERL